MRYKRILFLLLIVLSGCSLRPQAPDFSPQLKQWLSQQQYSVWEAVWDGKQEPRRPDGMTLGNRHIFAGIGCAEKDVSRIDPLYGDRKSLRVLTSPLEFSLDAENESLTLAAVAKQKLQRIQASSISIATLESLNKQVIFVDFAPLKPELNALIRLVLVENAGDTANYSLTFTGGMGMIEKRGRNGAIADDRLAIISDHALRVEDIQGRSQIRLLFGKIPTGESHSAVIAFIPDQNQSKREETIQAVQDAMKDLMALLNETLKEWQTWRAQVKLPTEDQRLHDLMDGILCMIKSHIGFDAIHTGSLRYPHTRAWVRDNYWVQRTLLEAGLITEAKLNLDFLYSAWQKTGLASYYEIEKKQGQAYGDIHIELPHYFVLMVKDAEKLGGIDGTQYWPMVKGCLEQAKLGNNGLQHINGDETWLLAAGINQLDYVLDNSMLLIASAEYGAELAQRMEAYDLADKYEAMATKAREAMRTYFMPSNRIGILSVSCSNQAQANSSVDELFPVAGVLARPFIFQLYQRDSEEFKRHSSTLHYAWIDLNYTGGIRAFSRSSVVDGGTPGYFLYALSDAHLVLSNMLVQRVMDDFVSDTGCVWELQSVSDPKWGLEKRRLWDSSVLLLGLLHHSKLYPPSFPVGADVGKGYTSSKLGKFFNTLGNDAEFIILEKSSSTHARELATQLARFLGKPVKVGKWPGFGTKGVLPSGNVIVITPELANINMEPYNISDSRIVAWVENRGNVFEDLRLLAYDLFRSATPQRKPAAFPDSDLQLAAEIGEVPTGRVEVKVVCEKPITISAGDQTKQGQSAIFSLDLAKTYSRTPANIQVHTSAGTDKVVALTVSARGGAPSAAKVEVAFPAGYYIVEARNLQATWDRAANPIDQLYRPDGRRVIVFQPRLGPGIDQSITVRLARPKVMSITE